MLRKSVVILAMLVSGMATQVLALGLGTTTIESALNQPLRVRIEIVDLGSTRLEDVTVQMASPDDFQRFDIDRVAFLSNIRFQIESTPGGDFAVLTSNQVVREPYLSFVLETRWPSGRLLSEHTVLLDLPVFNGQQQGTPSVRQPISPVLEPPSDAEPADEPFVEEPAQPVQEIIDLSEPVAPEPLPESAAVEEEESDEPEEAEQSVAEEAADALQPEPEVAAEPEEVAVADEPEPEAVAEEPPPLDASQPLQPEEETVTAAADDTLTNIALRVRPDNSVSLQQTMLAIQRLNPDAFIDGNVNRLRRGAVLRVPSLEAIQNVTPREAIDEIARQNQQFADLQPLAAPADAEPADTDTPQGELSVVTEEDAGAGGRMPDDAELAALDARIAELENQLAIEQEEADRARLERDELESRIADLDEQIAAAQEIIRLQDLQLAQLQESIAQAAAEAEAAAAQQAAMAEAEAELQRQAQARRSPLDDVVRILSGNILLTIFGIALVILLLVVLLLRRNRTQQAETGGELDELAEQEFAAANAVGTGDDEDAVPAGDELEDMRDVDLDAELDDILSVTGDDGDAGRDESNEDTVFARADSLIAGSRLADAASLLRGELEEEPEDHKVRLKLMEVFARQGDTDAFDAHADIIAADKSPVLDREVARLRERHSLAAAGQAGSTTKSVSAADDDGEDEASSFLDDLGIDLDDFDDDYDLEEGAGRGGGEVDAGEDREAAAPEPEVKPATAEDDDLDLGGDDMDLAFDLGGDDAAEDQGPRAEPTETDSELSLADGEELETSGLDDAGDEAELSSGDSKDAGELEIESLEFDVDEDTAGSDASQPVTDEDELDLETFEFESGKEKPGPDTEQESGGAGTEKAEADEDNALDFDFDKDEIKAAPEPEPVADDLETFDFDLDDTVVEKPAAGDNEQERSTAVSAGQEQPRAERQEEPEEAEPEEAAQEDKSFDFDLDEFEVDEEAPTGRTADADGDQDNGDETSFDLDTATGTAEDTTDISTDEDDVEIELEDEDQEDDKDDSDDALDDLEFLGDEDDDETSIDVEDVELLSEVDETATKLELAYAYQKMGDKEGAREILEEVMKEGSDEQVGEARTLLESLDRDD